MIKLWTINRALRWLGFVLVIETDEQGTDPTRIGFVWTGWPPDRGWAEHCERTRLAREAREGSRKLAAETRGLALEFEADVRRAHADLDAQLRAALEEGK
jgi:hypothetical protein